VARRDEIISQCGRNTLVKQSPAENFNNFQAVWIDCLKYSNVNCIYVHTLFLLFPNFLPLNFRCSFKMLCFFQTHVSKVLFFGKAKRQLKNFWQKRLEFFILLKSLLIEGLFLKCIHHFESLLLEFQRKNVFHSKVWLFVTITAKTWCYCKRGVCSLIKVLLLLAQRETYLSVHD